MKLTRTDLDALLGEARAPLTGARVEKIWREAPELYGLLLVREDENRPRERLLLEISLEKETGRVVALPAPPPERSAQRRRDRDETGILRPLRRHLVGAVIDGAALLPGERILDLGFDARRDDGLEPDPRPSLVIELTGKRTNLLLLSESRAIIAAHRHGRGLGGRDLVAGEAYAAPKPRPEREPAPAAFPTPEQGQGPLAHNIAVAEALRGQEDQDQLRSEKGRLRHAARRGLKRLRSRMRKLESEAEDARGADELQRQAQLLQTFASQIPKGARSFTAADPGRDDGAEIELTMEPGRSPLEQAEALFKRAKKLRRGLSAMEMRLGQTEADVEALEDIIESIDAAEEDDEAALVRIERELGKLDCLPKARASKPKAQENQGPRRYESRDGLTILVGRSNSENDRLTIQVARGNDLFFHVRGSPGSHVIVRKPKERTVPLETLLDAATLAVHYSKQRGNTQAIVNYTPRKNVRKPKGAKPGLVQIWNEKALRPGADPERLSRLLNSRQTEG